MPPPSISGGDIPPIDLELGGGGVLDTPSISPPPPPPG